ncbi:hypothetical protein ACFYYH_15075 [Streptomyces sp. NPDC002018]|uniref:hypothetical protein n=1 Tax=Streptomyces sp. NPDC002018 TaxID=3364629 RepID=UPI0036C46E4C
MSAHEELLEIVTRDPQSAGGDAVWATDLVNAYRAEVLREAAAELAKWLGMEQAVAELSRMANSPGSET